MLLSSAKPCWCLAPLHTLCARRWWAEAVRGVPRWMCFDACPTYACLPYVAARVKALTPHAKLVVMVSAPGQAADGSMWGAGHQPPLCYTQPTGLSGADQASDAAVCSS